jgi:hypothetical protein
MSGSFVIFHYIWGTANKIAQHMDQVKSGQVLNITVWGVISAVAVGSGALDAEFLFEFLDGQGDRFPGTEFFRQ